jgi:hypothetical protein
MRGFNLGLAVSGDSRTALSSIVRLVRAFTSSRMVRGNALAPEISPILRESREEAEDIEVTRATYRLSDSTGEISYGGVG